MVSSFSGSNDVLNDFAELTLPCRRPGIIVLVNDQDWELLEKEEYNLEEGDEVVFVSTLHGKTIFSIFVIIFKTNCIN